MITWPTVKATLKQLAVRGTGLPAERVVWAKGKGPRKEGPWMDINIFSIDSVARAFTTTEMRSPPVAGEEVVQRTCAPRLMTVSYRYFSGDEDMPPEGVLDTMILRAQQESFLQVLAVAGIGTSSWGPVINLPGGSLGTTVYEPRSQTQLLAYLASEVEEYTTYIESAEFTVRATDEDGIVKETTRIVEEGES